MFFGCNWDRHEPSELIRTLRQHLILSRTRNTSPLPSNEKKNIYLIVVHAVFNSSSIILEKHLFCNVWKQSVAMVASKVA